MAETIKTVYFVRHGQSEDNAAPVFQSSESPLSDLGKKQAEKIAHRISKLSFEGFVASPVRRAKETAMEITKLINREPEFSELFVEKIKPEILSGKPRSDIEASKLWYEWEKTWYASGIRVEGGENYDDLILRADKALKFLESRPEKSIVVVTHGFFLRTIVARVILGDTLSPASYESFQRRVTMENTGLSALKLVKTQNGDLVWRLWVYNDHAHLG